MKTPWGESQSVSEIAPGIQVVSTASHGGFLLSHDRLTAMPDELKTPNAFYPSRMGASWFGGSEREAARVVLAFPGCFTPEQVEKAQMTWEKK